MVFQGDSYRVFRAVGSGPAPGNRKTIATPEFVMLHTDDVGPDGKKAVVMTGAPEHFSEHLKTYILNPRLLGMTVDPLQALFRASLHEEAFVECIGRPEQPELVVTTETEEGGQGVLHRFAYTVPENSVDVVLWLDPLRGDTVRRGEIRGVLRGVPVVDAVDVHSIRYDVQLKSGELAEVWYPEFVRYTRSVDGIPQVFQETRVLEADFSIEVGAGEFELARLNAPPGTHVIERPSFSARLWDGEQLQPVISADSVSEPVLELEQQPRRVWLLVAVNLGAVALLLFFWYLRRVWRRRRPE